MSGVRISLGGPFLKGCSESAFSECHKLDPIVLLKGVHFYSGSPLITPGNAPDAAYAASADPKITQANTEYWGKILERATAKNELRDDLDVEDLMNWLLGVQSMFMERREIFPLIKDVKYYATEFIVPALRSN